MNKGKTQRPMEQPLAGLAFLYQATGKNASIFTAENARMLKQTEAIITGSVLAREGAIVLLRQTSSARA